MRIVIFVFLIVSLAMCATGCSDKIKVKGRVTYADSGDPLTIGSVCFEANGYVARGKLDGNGNYQLTSIKPNDGVPPGNYKVFVDGALEPAGKNNLGQTAKVAILDRKYTDPAKPTYTFEVNRSNRTFDFTVERIKK